jgi:hypothetical protein
MLQDRLRPAPRNSGLWTGFERSIIWTENRMTGLSGNHMFRREAGLNLGAQREVLFLAFGLIQW